MKPKRKAPTQDPLASQLENNLKQVVHRLSTSLEIKPLEITLTGDLLLIDPVKKNSKGQK